jgi:putative endopeptidase
MERRRGSISWKQVLCVGVLMSVPLLLLWACRRSSTRKQPNGVPNFDHSSEDAIKDVAATIDISVDPGKDFYRFSSGSWLRDRKLPPGTSTLSRSFYIAQSRITQFTRDLIAGKYPPTNPAALNKIQTYYASCMDLESIEKLGLSPVQPLLDRIDHLSDMSSFMAATGALQLANVPVLFGSTVFPDSKSPAMNLLQFTQGGLGLAGPSYYAGAQTAPQQGYVSFMQQMFTFSGMNSVDALAAAQRVLAFEMQLANASWSFADLNDATKTYNPTSFSDFQGTTPALPWKALFDAQDIPVPSLINVQVPPFFAALQQVLPATPVAVLRDYLKVHLLLGMAQQLPQRFRNAYFELYGKQLGGLSEPQPRASYCEAATVNDLGDLIAEQYVQISLSANDKEVVNELVSDLRAELRSTLANSGWMDEPTRKVALAKANAMISQTVAPSTRPPEANLTFDKLQWAENFMAVARQMFQLNALQAGRPVDRNAWYTNALTVNAYYDPQRNVIVVPAGILQPPFFGSGFPAAMNYGSIGAIVGHELTHGFDSNGRRFDASGRLDDWWSAASAAEFAQRAECFKKEYSAFEPFPGIHVNGSQTLNENIADNGGLGLAYAAYQNWKKRHGPQPSPIRGLSDDQLFFVAFGQTWATVSTEAFERAWLMGDPHAPPEYRVRGSVANSEPFSSAFHLSPEKGCRIW